MQLHALPHNGCGSVITENESEVGGTDTIDIQKEYREKRANMYIYGTEEKIEKEQTLSQASSKGKRFSHVFTQIY